MISNKRIIASLAVPSCCLLMVMALTFPEASIAWLPSAPLLKRAGLSDDRLSLVAGMVRLDDDESPPPHEQPQQQSQQHKNAQRSSSSSSGDNELASSFAPQQQRNVTQEVLKKIRVAKAQAEIDRILQGPDPPVDTEAELEKVVSMSHIPSEQPLLDAEMAQLESELYQAVKQQDFSLASSKKNELGQLERESSGVDDGGAILQVNAAFYRAFSKKSFEDMERVWLRHDGDTSVCIHPSHKPLVGARRISKSWKQMFASTDGSFQRNWMEPHQIRVMLKGSSMAIVTCEEHVFAKRFVRGKKRQTELINKLLATNIFRKVGDSWYMTYHHASWHPESEAAKRALSGDGSGNKVVSTREYKPTSSLAADLAARRRRRRRQLEDEDDDGEEVEIGMNGILGSGFGPILGDGKPDNEEKPTKRIIMGASLSDIINGGLGDLLGDGGIDQSGDQNNDVNSNLGLPQEGAIIRFSRIEGEDEDEDEDDLDISDMGEMDDEDDDDDSESVAIIKEWAKSSSQASKRDKEGQENNDVQNQEETVTGAADQKNGKVFKDALRQNCISALRRLADQGNIAPKQKRVLLTDIITSSARGEFSMVEVAYELLCGEGDADEQEAAEEEFAEQCRVFAQELLLKQESQML